MSPKTAWTWTVNGEPTQVEARADQVRYRVDLERGGAASHTFVEITGTAAASPASALPSPVDAVVASNGLSFFTDTELSRFDPPQRVEVSTAGLAVYPRAGSYLPGDLVDVRVGDEWIPAAFVEPGEPADAVPVRDPQVAGGMRHVDVARVRVDSGETRHAVYSDIRPRGDDPAGT